MGSGVGLLDPPTTQLPPSGAHDCLSLEESPTRMSSVTTWLHPPESLSAHPTRHDHWRGRTQACSPLPYLCQGPCGPGKSKQLARPGQGLLLQAPPPQDV